MTSLFTIGLTLSLFGCRPPPLACGDGDENALTYTHEGSFLYRENALPQFSLTLDDEAMDGLATLRQEDLPDVVANLEIFGDTYEVGLRLKGKGSFRTIERKAAFKIDLHEWHPDQTLHGVRRITLNNMLSDRAKLAEHVTYTLYERMGLPAPRHGYACVEVNGEDFGLYGVVETMDEQFVERVWPDDPNGNLYEGAHGAALRDGLTDGFVLQESGTPEPYSDLEALVSDHATTTDEAFMGFLDETFSLTDLMRAWAIELSAGNHDGYLIRSNNYLLYHQPVADIWWFVPWGVDETWRLPLDVTAPFDAEEAQNATHGVLLQRCMRVDPCVDALRVAIEEVVELMERSDLLGEFEWQRDLIRDVSRHDPRDPLNPSDVRQAQRQMRRFVRDRPDAIRDDLDRH